VRSAYNLARTARFWEGRSQNSCGTGSVQYFDEKGWKRLWSVQCPNRIKVVLWHIAHNCLPTGAPIMLVASVLEMNLLNMLFFIVSLPMKSGME
jgi:hypothetical protein